MLRYVYKDKCGTAEEFYVMVSHKENKAINQDYMFDELAYEMTKSLTRKIGSLEVFILDDGDCADLLLSLCKERLFIDGQDFGSIFASSVLMPKLAYMLNLHDYIKLPKATPFGFSHSFMFMHQEISLFVAEYLYTFDNQSERYSYMSVRIANGDAEFTIYLDNIAVTYLINEFFDLSQEKENLVESINIYGHLLADILVSTFSCYFNLNLNLLSVRLGYLKKQINYLPVLVQHNKYFGFTILVDGWQKIDGSALSLMNQEDYGDDDTVESNNYKEEARMYIPLSIGSSNLSLDEFNILHTGDVLLLDECYVPNNVMVNCINKKLRFSIKENKLVLADIIN